MSLSGLLEIASNKNNFLTLNSYIEFCQRYIKFVESGLQAVIVSQNEPNYQFFQYRDDGYFNITRPINANLMYSAIDRDVIFGRFLDVLRNAKDIPEDDEDNRAIIRKSIYTIQQAIGATLDALPAGKSNTARKINGDLFERLIRLLLLEIGLDCRNGVINVPVIVEGLSNSK